jgi:hypothetical protein
MLKTLLFIGILKALVKEWYRIYIKFYGSGTLITGQKWLWPDLIYSIKMKNLLT